MNYLSSSKSKTLFFFILVTFLFSCNIEFFSKKSETYHDNGKVKMKFNYVNGFRYGVSQEFDKEGQLIREWNYKNNKLNGVTIEYFPKTDKVKYEWLYLEDLLDGVTIEYHLDGSTSHWTYSSNLLIDGKSFYASGELSEEYTIINGLRNGESRGYYKTGELKIIWNFIDGSMEGINKEYYKSGKIFRLLNYEHNVLNGVSKEYLESGELKYDWLYKDGVLDGVTKEYDKDGILKANWVYKNDTLI